jgi:hypothetical protein
MAVGRPVLATLLATLALAGCGPALPGMIAPCPSDNPKRVSCSEYQVVTCKREKCGTWRPKRRVCHCEMRTFYEASRSH